jgi:hypothetical protein
MPQEGFYGSKLKKMSFKFGYFLREKGRIRNDVDSNFLHWWKNSEL